MNQQLITRGSRVKFDKDGTTLTGTVFNIVNDILNGRKMANVEIEHELPGVIEIVPFDKLEASPISHTIAFLKGAGNFLKPETDDRRFCAIPTSESITNANDCAKILSLIAHLCGFNSKLLAHVLCWLAYPLQNDGKRNPSALVFKHEPGCGVSLFFGEVMRPIYIDQFTTIDPFNLSASSFNEWAKSKRLVLCEDITLDRYFKTQSKHLISSPAITVNARMREPETVENKINYVFTARTIPSELNVDTPHRLTCLHPITASNADFYKDVYSEIKLGGIVAFRKYLLSLDLTEYKKSFFCV